MNPGHKRAQTILIIGGATRPHIEAAWHIQGRGRGELKQSQRELTATHTYICGWILDTNVHTHICLNVPTLPHTLRYVDVSVLHTNVHAPKLLPTHRTYDNTAIGIWIDLSLIQTYTHHTYA